MALRAILSDAGGIIVDDTHGPTHLYPAVARLAQVGVNELKKGFRIYRERAMTEQGYSARKSWRDYLCSIGRKDVMSEFNKIYNKTWPVLAAYPGVKETLSELERRGIKFIVISDTARSGAEYKQRLEKMGYRGITDVVTSKDVGVMKPDKRIFDAALARHGLMLEDVVFLAHDHDELKGAHDLGFRVLALNYRQDDDLGFIPPGRRLSEFSQLLSLDL